MKRRIAIIGANSYIARNVIHVLQKDYRDSEVLAYDNTEQQADDFEYYAQLDILSEASIKKIDFSVDIIFMFIGKTGSMNGFDEYHTFIDINEISLLNVLNEYRRQNSRAKIIFPSTRLVYKGKKGLQDEAAEKEFKTIYAINKFACEQYLEMYHRMYGVQYSIFRICVPYGTLIPGAASYGTAEFMLSKALKGEDISLYGNGSVRRTITYIGDLCRTLIEGAAADECVNDIYNIGGEDYSLKEMAELIAKKYCIGIKYVDWPDKVLKIESGDTVFNSSKLEQIINIENKKTFSEWISD